MAWMNDYEYDFVTDSASKKNIARSARSTRTHCGKGGAVKFPSDYLSKKELKAMSGQVIEYASLKKPMSWDEFKALPADLKKEYISSIRKNFGAPDKYIAQMLGVSGRTLSLYLNDFGLNAGKDAGNGKRKWKQEEFYAWSSGADMTAECAPVTETDPEINTDSSSMSDKKTEGCSCEKICAVPGSGQLTFTCPADQALNMIGMVLGNKNVKLHVAWNVIEEEESDEARKKEDTEED